MINFSMLDGKKTYISSILMAGAVFLNQSGLINQQTFQALLGLFGAMGLSFLRMGIKKGNGDGK